jgi:hypothetical protein
LLATLCCWLSSDSLTLINAILLHIYRNLTWQSNSRCYWCTEATLWYLGSLSEHGF